MVGTWSYMWSTCRTVFFETVVWAVFVVHSLWICRKQIKFLSSVWGINTVDACRQSLHYIFCLLYSLGCLRMAGKVFGPECDDAESVLGTRNVLHPHCFKCGQTLDACWPFQQLSHFTSCVTLVGTNKQTNWDKLVTWTLFTVMLYWHCSSYRLVADPLCWK